MVNNVEIIKTMIYNSKLMNCSQKKNPVAIRKIGLKKLSSFIKNPILRCQGTSHLLETVLSKRESFCAQKLNRALKFQTSSVVIYHWTNLAIQLVIFETRTSYFPTSHGNYQARTESVINLIIKHFE